MIKNWMSKGNDRYYVCWRIPFDIVISNHMINDIMPENVMIMLFWTTKKRLCIEILKI